MKNVEKCELVKNLKNERRRLVKQRQKIDQITINSFLESEVFDVRMAMKIDINSRIAAINNLLELYKPGQGS